MERVLVLSTSFMDPLITHPKEEGEAARMLARLAGGSDGKIRIDYRCDRDPRDPLSGAELDRTAATIADLELYSREVLQEVGAGAGGPLKLIARYGVGYDTVDLEAAVEFGVIVTNCPGCNAMPTAELTVATILDIAGRRIPHYETASRGKTKEGPSRLDVFGKTLGTIGTGAIGKNVFRLMKGYEVKGIAYDPFPDRKWAEKAGVEYLDSIDAVCKRSDIITLHAASNDTLIDERRIRSMRPTTVLINCARRHLVDNEAVYRAVERGELWGYGMDEIWHLDLPLQGLNIVVSPHVGSDTDMGKIGMQVMSAQAVVDFMEGFKPRHVVNREVLKSPIYAHLRDQTDHSAESLTKS